MTERLNNLPKVTHPKHGRSVILTRQLTLESIFIPTPPFCIACGQKQEWSLKFTQLKVLLSYKKNYNLAGC
jgi:hypothetical protein